MREYLALCKMGINVNDTIWFSCSRTLSIPAINSLLKLYLQRLTRPHFTSVSGLCKLSLQDFLTLTSGPVLKIGSQKPDVDDLDWWHCRHTDTSHQAICKAMRNKLIEVYMLDCKVFDVLNRRSYRRSCNNCARAKVHLVISSLLGCST